MVEKTGGKCFGFHQNCVHIAMCSTKGTLIFAQLSATNLHLGQGLNEQTYDRRSYAYSVDSPFGYRGSARPVAEMVGLRFSFPKGDGRVPRLYIIIGDR